MDPKYHPKIIGRKGAVITQIRLEHDVNIQFPDKDDGGQVGALRPHAAAPGGRWASGELCPDVCPEGGTFSRTWLCRWAVTSLRLRPGHSQSRPHGEPRQAPLPAAL